MAEPFDTIILGAGAAGLMCGIEAARRGLRVAVLDHAARPAEKIRISGGGKCNFTHLKATPKNFLSDNPPFCISALKRFTPFDFLERVTAHGIAYTEKTEGQLFCETSAQAIINMLLDDLEAAGGELWLNTRIDRISKGDLFEISCGGRIVRARNLVIATGALSIPKMGATPFAYEIARQFGHAIVDPQPGLVPFTLGDDKLNANQGLAGLSLTARVSVGTMAFTDGFLFTHRGLSGPACLQISSYWRPGQALTIDLLPDIDLATELSARRNSRGKQNLGNALAEYLPRRLSDRLIEWTGLKADSRVAEMSNAGVKQLADAINRWTLVPLGTEGYRTAEVTVGGVDTKGLSSQTMESLLCPGLYFIGECVDVTGWLGGYNFQWAWASGWVCGRSLSAQG